MKTGPHVLLAEPMGMLWVRDFTWLLHPGMLDDDLRACVCRAAEFSRLPKPREEIPSPGVSEMSAWELMWT